MTAFHPGSVKFYFIMDRKGIHWESLLVSPNWLSGLSLALVEQQERRSCLRSCVCPVGGWLHPRKVKPWPALWALVSGRASLAFSLCCLALEQH